MEVFIVLFIVLLFVGFFGYKIVRLDTEIRKLNLENEKTALYISVIANSLQELAKIAADLQDGALNQAKVVKSVADHSVGVSKNLEDFQLTVYDCIKVLTEQIKTFSLVKSKSSPLSDPIKKNDKIKPN